MNACIKILNLLKAEMETPEIFGWFHIMWLVLVVGFSVLLCTKFRRVEERTIRRAVFAVSVVVAVLEVYKQLVYTFDATETGITGDFQWYAFPWQFCSTPMYAGLLTGIFRKGRIHDALCAYLATFAVFAGVCVSLYPSDVFIEMIGINVQTMICHGSMVVIGVWLLATGYVKSEQKTIVKAAAVFACAVLIAVVLNEAVVSFGWNQGETFNMFFISRHFEGTLPVYSLVQQVVPYPWCLILYVAVFTLAAYVVLLVSILIHRQVGKKAVAC